MTGRTISSRLIGERQRRLRSAIADAPFDAVLALSPTNVDYASGYRSVSAAVHGTSSVGVLLSGDDLTMAGAVADSAPAFDAGIDEDSFHAFGRFYFESSEGAATATGLVDQHADFASAVIAAVGAGSTGITTIGVDESVAGPTLLGALAESFPSISFVPASTWLMGVRAIKLPGEVELIERCARVTEQAILDGIDALGVGRTENDIARVVASSMSSAGVNPRFVVVTSGPRSALADAFATERVIGAGELVRFDVGGVLDGYWSDLGRTAVMGEPSGRQQRTYDALLAGVDAQLALMRPGVLASSVFDVAITTVEHAGGPAPYRRQHCGHGIGLDVYEPPIVRPGDDVELADGMTFCLETPYYQLGWGGMMVEDTVVVTDDGIRMLSDRDRGMSVVDL